MWVGVAIMDSGVFRHKDFDNRIIAFKDFVNHRNVVYDDNGHGTHVAGIIAGSGIASKGKYRGICPNARIIGVKVLDKYGNGMIKNVVDASEWIISNKDLYNIKIVNISFGTSHRELSHRELSHRELSHRELSHREISHREISHRDISNNEISQSEFSYGENYDNNRLIGAVEKMWDNDIVVVAAAGNNGPKSGTITSPGISKKIITVGAYDDYNYNSGRGPTSECVVKPEVVVSGSNIIACSNMQGKYTRKSGTSMAAPIVTGSIARMFEKRYDLTPKQVKMWMKECCKHINADDNKQGWGELQIKKFVGDVGEFDIDV